MIIAGLCGLSAGVFLFERDFDKAFIVAAAGAIAWFMNYRVQLKEIINKEDKERENKETSDDQDET
jgi:hypothetical protein